MSRVDLHEHDDRRWAIAQARLRVIAALAVQEAPQGRAVAAAAWELGVSRAYCYRLLRRYRDDPTVTGLIPLARGRLVGAKVLDPAIEPLIEAAIDEHYLTPECPTLASLVREVARRCAERTLPAPTYKAVLARVIARKRFDVLKHRKGVAQAFAQATRVAGHLTAQGPLALMQIDHTLADVIVVAEGSRLPIGRPWLTLAIDVATRMVAGFYLNLERAVGSGRGDGVEPLRAGQGQLSAGRDIDIAWPVHGVPERVHLDDAKEFHSQALARGVEQYGIEVVYRPPAQPHWCGHIERLVGTMMGAIHLLPGSTSRNFVEKGAYDAEAAAVMTMADLEAWLIHQIAGVYHHSVHRGIGVAPITAWTQAMEQRPPPRMPPDPDRLYLDFLPFESAACDAAGSPWSTSATRTGSSRRCCPGRGGRSWCAMTRATCHRSTCATRTVSTGPSRTSTDACPP